MPNTASRVATHQDHEHCSAVGVCPPEAETNWVATKTLSCPTVQQLLGVQPRTRGLVLGCPTFEPPQKQPLDCRLLIIGKASAHDAQ